MKGLKVITKVTAGNKKFTIVKNEDGYYLAIEQKYITNGKLNQKLNGLQMHATQNLQETISSAITSAKVDELMEQGYSLEDAITNAVQSY